MHERVASRRSIPYPEPGVPVYVPKELWQASLDELRRYATARSEALVFWGGITCGGQIQVTGLYVLGHSAQGSTVKMTPDETRWLLRELRRRDEKLVAQFHSHPGQAYHSWGDDARAASFHEGLLSIVAPHYALNAKFPADCAVHEYSGGAFHLLEPAAVAERLHLQPWTTRLRATPVTAPGGGAEEETTWITMIASSLKKRLIGHKRR